MKHTFTKTLNILLLIITCMLAGFNLMAQYTVTVPETGKHYRAMAKDNAGNIYVVRANTTGQYEVARYAPNGDPATAVSIYGPLGASAIEYPWGLAVNDDGDVFVTDIDGSGWKVIKLDAGNSYANTTIRTGSYYSALAVDNANNLLVLEFYNRGDADNTNDTYRLMRYPAGNEGSPTGTQLYDVLPYPTNTPQTTYPWGIAVDGQDNIYIIDRIENSEGKLIKLSAPNFNTPATIASGNNFTSVTVDGQGNVFTIESTPANDAIFHVVKYTAPVTAGQSGIAVPTTPATTLSSGSNVYPWGIIVNSGGDIFVNDGAAPGNGRLLKLTPPAINVTSVTRAAASPTNAATVTFTVKFSGAASNVTAAAFALTTTGVTGASIAPAITTVTPDTYTVTVNTGSGDGTIRLDVNGSGISPTVIVPPGGYVSGESYTIDKTLPTGTMTIAGGAAYTTAATVTLNLNASDPGGGAITMAINNGSGFGAFGPYAANPSVTFANTTDGTKTIQVRIRDAAGNILELSDDIILDATAPQTIADQQPADPTNNNTSSFVFSSSETPVTYEMKLDADPTFTAIVGNTLDLTGLTDGPHTITVRAKDPAGNVDATPYTYTWTVDRTAPTVTQVFIPPAATYKDGDVLSFQVEFSENIAVTPLATTSLDVIIGATTRKALLSAVTGGNTAVFSYTLQQPDMDNDGIALGPVSLNGSTVTDLALNNANLTLNGVPATSGILVNTKHPVPTITTTAPSLVNGPFTITITFDEEVTNDLVAAEFNSINATLSNLTPAGDNKTWTALITPPGGVQSGNGAINVLQNAVTNVAGNGNVASNAYNYTYDTKAPAITSINPPANGYYKAGDVLSYTVNYDENISLNGGTPTLPVIIGAITQNAQLSSSTASSLTFSYTILADEEDLDGLALGAAIALNGSTITDAAGNNAALAVSAATPGVLVDALSPDVNSVNVPANGYYKAGDVLSFTLNISENVTVTNTPSIDVVIGTATRKALYAGGSGTGALTFTYTVVPGDNDMDGITVGASINLEGGNIRDAAQNDIDLTLNNVAPTNNIRVNTQIPSVTLSTTAPGLINAQFTVTAVFSEAVTGFTIGDLAVSNAGLSSLATSDNITYTFEVSPLIDGPVSVQLPAGVVQNIGGNANMASNTLNLFYDQTAPLITGASLPAGNYKLGDVLSFTLTSSEILNVGGTPYLTFDIGSSPERADLYNSDGSSTPVFRYVVKAGDLDVDGIVLGPQIEMNGGFMHDVAGNHLNPAVNGNFTGVIIDGIAPTISSVDVPANGYYNAGDVLTFTVHINENVTVMGAPAVGLTVGADAKQAAYVSGSGSSALVFSYTVQPGDMDMNGIQLTGLTLNGGTIRDQVGNDAALTLNNVGNTTNVMVNTAIPTVTLSGTPAPNAPWTMTITFSEAVTVLTTGDIIATNATLGALSTPDNITFTVEVTPVDDGAVTLQVPANAVVNIGNNPNTASNILSYAYDGTAPDITSVAVPADDTYTLNQVLSFTVNFNENVTVTGTPSFDVIIGAATRQAQYTGGSGTNALSFTYTVVNGDLDVDGISLGTSVDFNGGSIRDASSNAAAAALAGVGNTTAVLVDAARPGVIAVNVPANGYYKAGDVLAFTVQYGENVTVNTAAGRPSIPLIIGAVTVDAVYVSGSGTNQLTFSYTVRPGDMDMNGIQLDDTTILLNSGIIRDLNGNNALLGLATAGSTSGVLVNTIIPSVTIDGTITLTSPWTATITFSDAVTGFTLADITTVNATVSDLQTTDNITYTALITPVVQGNVSLLIPGNVAQNIGGNGNTPSNSLSYYYDPNPPVITSVEVPANGYHKQGDVLNFAVNWNENVTVINTPTLPVMIGTTPVQASYTGGTNTNRITFAYTIQPGEMDLDGIAAGNALMLNGSAFIRDLSGNNAVLTLNNVASTAGVFVHTGRPSVTLTSAAAARLNAPFNVTVTFNEAVTQLALADFTLTNATVSALQTTDNVTYTVLVTPTTDGAVSISLPADAAVNIINNGNAASNSIARTYDATPPVIAAGQSFTVSQFSPVGAVAGAVTASDASGTLQNWAIATDGANGAFAISAAGIITVRDATALSALAGTTVTVGITVNDGLNTSAGTPVSIRVQFVNQAPTLDAIADAVICANSTVHTVQLTGASATEPGQTYSFTVRAEQDLFDQLSVSAAGVLTYQLRSSTASGRATITVTIRDNGGTAGGGVDSLRRSFNLTINALPAITITSDKGASVSKGDVAHLTATGAATYAWTNADGIIGGQSTAVLEIRPKANITYEVTGASAAGCTNVATFNITVIEDFKVDATNILTPNGDGHNDKWVIRNIDSYPDNELKIFDRAGRMIYTRRNYSNDWDATVNGQPLAEGTYYYILTIGNGAKTAKGYITIVRDRY